jgi:HlyD family secretion protein
MSRAIHRSSGICAVAVLALASVPELQGPPAVEVRSGSLARTIRVSGSTAAAASTILRAPYLRGNRGRGSPGDFQLELTQLAKPGSHVREGDIVAVFDNENMRNRLDNDQAEVDEAEGAVKRLIADQAAQMEAHQQKIRVARAAVDTATLDLKTARVRSQIDAQKFALTLEESRATLDSLNAETPNLRIRQAAELRAAELELQRATVDARRAKANLEHLAVHAPMDGLLVAEQIYRFGQFGEIRQGDELRPGQPYLRIADLRRMVVEASANQVDGTDLRIGQPVHLRFDAYSNLELTGHVQGVGAMARGSGFRGSYVAEIPLTIAVDATDPRVIPGLTVSGDIRVAGVENAPIVPRQAIFYDDDRPYAFVQTPTGWERRELELDLTDHLEAAVRTGIVPGERVALERPSKWRASRSMPTTSVSPRGPKSPGG